MCYNDVIREGNIRMSYLILSIAMFVSSAIGFAFGFAKYIKPHKPLYASMIVLGVGCIMIGRAYILLRLVIGLEIAGIFHVGMLGTVGGFAFFFSANFGQIDSLVDGGEKIFRKYRIIPLLSIVVTAILYMFVFFGNAPLAEKITDGIVALSIAAASYFHLKHLIIPDVDYGVVRCQRGYNLIALIYGILCMCEMTAAANMLEPVVIAACILECVATLVLVPVMDMGVKKWSR